MEQWTGSKLGKEYAKAVCYHPAYLTYAEYIMPNARLDEAQAGIKIAGRNINNVRYADDTTVMAESEEGVKCILMRVKEESGKAGLKLSIQKTKIMASSSTTLWKIDGEKVETVTNFILLGSKITEKSLLEGKAMTNLDSILKSETSLCLQRYGFSSSHVQL